MDPAVAVKIEINRVSESPASEFHHKPGLPHLPGALDNQGLSAGLVLPGHQILQGVSLHTMILARISPFFKGKM
jgi:hypothetical protein